MNQKGITLVETLVVLALISIILSLTVPFSLQMVRKSRAESEIRTLFGNVTEARQRAVQRSVPYIVRVSSTGVDVYEDTNNDGSPDPAEKLDQLSDDSISYSLTGDVGGQAIVGCSTPNCDMALNVHGVLLPTSSIFLKSNGSDTGPDDAVVNCMSLDTTRIGLGKKDASNNCVMQ